MTEILVKKFKESKPRFSSLAEEGKFERDLGIDRKMKEARKAEFDVLWHNRIRVGVRTHWEKSALERYQENYSKIDWKK